MEDIKLTKLSKCAGCGAKVSAGVLSKLLSDLPVLSDENLLVGFDKSDDAAVYRVSDEQAIVQTIDFFPPIADDPYLFGQIAAANALSDVYAMGGEPKLALNVMCVPGLFMLSCGEGMKNVPKPVRSSAEATASLTTNRNTALPLRGLYIPINCGGISELSPATFCF